MSSKYLCTVLAALAACCCAEVALAAPVPATTVASPTDGSAAAQLDAARKAIADRDALIVKLRAQLTDRDDMIGKLLGEIRAASAIAPSPQMPAVKPAPVPSAPTTPAALASATPTPPALSTPIVVAPPLSLPASTAPATPMPQTLFGSPVDIRADAFYSALGVKDFTVIRVDNQMDNPVTFDPQMRVVGRDGTAQAATIVQVSSNYAAIDPRATDERTIEARTFRHDATTDYVDHQYDVKSPQDLVVPAHTAVFFKISYNDVVQSHPLRIEFTGALLDGCALAYPGPHSGPYALALIKLDAGT